MKRFLFALPLLVPFFAAAPPAAAQRAYVAEVFDGTLSVIDLRRQPAQVLATVPAGTLPLAVAAERHGRRLFVTSLDSGNVTVFDLTVLPPRQMATIAVGGELGGLAASPTADRLYVAKYDSGQVAVIDTAATPPVVLHTLSGFAQPDGVAWSADGSRVYVTNSEDELATLSTVSVIDATRNPPLTVATVPVDPEPHGIAVAAGRVFVASADLGTVSMIDTATHQVVDTLLLSSLSRPYALALSPEGDRLYVTDAEPGGRIFVVGVAPNQLSLLETYAFDSPSYGIDILPDGRVAAGHFSSRQLKILDFSSLPGTESAAIPVGDSPASFGTFIFEEPPGFADGFESGDTAAWSLTVD